MAATAPTILYPAGAETGMREDRLIVLKSDYAGDGTQVEWQIQVATDSGFAAADIVHDTGLRAPDSGGSANHVNADNWWQLFPVLWDDGNGAQPGTQYHMRARVRNSEPTTSSWSATVAFTFATADLTAAEWEGAA